MPPDRDAGNTTLWRRIAAELEVELAGMDAGQRLPSEAALGRRFEVSRVTLRQALSELDSRGLVTSRPGRGWFAAADAVNEPAGRLQSFTNMAHSRGLHTDAVVLVAALRPASWEEAQRLRLVPGADLFVIRRLRRLDGLPVALDHSRVPAVALAQHAEVDWSTASLHDELRTSGWPPAYSDTELSAVNAEADEADLLEVPEGFALLTSAHLTFDTTDRPVEYGSITYRGDRYRYRAQVRS